MYTDISMEFTDRNITANKQFQSNLCNAMEILLLILSIVQSTSIETTQC